MDVTAQAMEQWCRKLIGAEPADVGEGMEDLLASVPRTESLLAVPPGTAVLVRGDVDAKVGEHVGEGDVRLRSMMETLEFGRERGWVQVICGHIGRKPEGSLSKVAARLGQLLDAPVRFVGDWLDEGAMEVREEALGAVATASAGDVIVLENTRRYEIERVLWKANAADLAAVSERLAAFANNVAGRLAEVYIHEAFSAGSLDASSVVLPAAMRRAVLGNYAGGQFDGPMRRCLETELVVFSGLKIDKLDDLEAMIARGKIRKVIAAGSLAMALKRAAAELDGETFCLGLAEDAGHADKPYYIPRERIDQAREMIAAGRKSGIEFVLPVDFVLGNGEVATTLGAGDQQFDVGPASSEVFAAAVSDFIATSQSREGRGAVAFHNGVFGMFEDERFAEGTRRFVGELKRMHDAGVEVYVGGGEGGKALERYGAPDWVTHCFTAGGTVLNALGNEPVPYLLALAMAAAER